MHQETVQSDRKYVADSATLLRDTQFQLNELLPKLRAARDGVERAKIRAPVTGRVLDLRIFTVGGVVAAAQPLMEVVPDAAQLIIRANFSPTDVDGIREGGDAQIRLLSLHERDLPILAGKVRTVSADALRDEHTGRSYFTAEIVIPESQVRILQSVRKGDSGIRPGVPVQVSVPLRKRTALQYLLEPLTEAMSRSFHER